MKLLAIDGNSILNRAFFGVRLLSNKQGVYTNAIFGFLNILLKLEREHRAEATVIAFDVSRHTFRNDQYDGYKANRKGMPEELAVQLPLIKEILTDMGYPIVTCEGYEGDDVLGTLAAKCCGGGDTCVIATGDRDCLQLVRDCVSVCLIKTKEHVLYTPERLYEEYGFSPLRIIDMKALMGDASDNIPGVKGIGEKTALGLLQKNGSLEEIYDRLQADKLEGTPRIKQLLADGREMAFLSKQLATICTTAPIDIELSDCVRRPVDETALAEILTRLELYSFLEKFKLHPTAETVLPEAAADTAPMTCTVLSGETVADLADVAVQTAQAASLLLEGDRLWLNLDGTVYRLSVEKAASLLQKLAERQTPITTFQAKPLYKLANKLKIELNIAVDLELAAYLLSPGSKSYDIPSLRLRWLPELTITLGDTVAAEDRTTAEAAVALPKLAEPMHRALEQEGMTDLFEKIEMPLCRVLAEMEQFGFAVDRSGVNAFGERLAGEIAQAREEIIRHAGEEFNPNSTKELGHILFEKLGLPAKKKTKTGYSTNIEVLEELAEMHPIVPWLIEYRQLTKLYSTYVVGLLNVISEDGRVHSTFNQTETRTGRISSTEPNVQNIPVRTALGSEMRRFFVAREGYTLVDADYSQIELRILAHIANDRTMIAAFQQGADIHAITASQVFGRSADDLPQELRSRAKAINFGIVYGIGAFSLSKNIHVSVSEAKAYIEAYLRTYSGVADYQRDVVEQARRDGYVTTLYGRRRDLADIRATNRNIRAFAERVAMNTPIQGTAADIIKLAMNRVSSRLRRESLDARLILQVHDELIVEARDDLAPTVERLLKEEMEAAAVLQVPLVADVSVGKTWYAAKG